MPNMISIILNLCSLGSVIIILVLSAFTVSLKEKINLIFFINIVCLLINFFVDMGIGLLTGHSGNLIRILIRMFDFISYLIAGFQIIIFAGYLYEFFCIKAEKTEISKKSFIIMSIIGVITIIASAIALFTGLILLDENNNYVHQPTFWLLNIFYIILTLNGLLIVIKNIKFIKTSQWVSLMLYFIIPLACYICEFIIPNFYIALFGASFTMSLIYINIQLDLKHQMQQKEIELTENRIAIMLSQIQPHFLYNSLSVIDNLIYIDSDSAHNALLDFSNYLRRNLDSLSLRELIMFEKELEHTKQYLRLEELRFGNRLKVIYDIKTYDFMIPPITLQPIAENAVRYGVTKKRDGGTIIISAEENDTDGNFIITVTDDGVGFDVTAISPNDERSHTGISNVQSRLNSMCGGTLVIESTINKGTKATVIIPARKERID